MIAPATHLIASMTSVTVTSAATLAAQVAEAPGGVVTITSAGATASAVAALIYVFRLWAAGKIVARPTADRDDALVDIAHTLTRIVEDNHRREDIAIQREERFYAFVTKSGA